MRSVHSTAFHNSKLLFKKKIFKLQKFFQSQVLVMPSKGHKKNFASTDYVECAKCRARFLRKWIETHWETYRDGGRGYPKHQCNSNTKKINELEDPLDKQSKPIRIQSILNMFGVKNNDHNLNQNVGESIIEDMNYKYTNKNKKPPLRP
eukprot:502590_1